MINQSKPNHLVKRLFNSHVEHMPTTLGKSFCRSIHTKHTSCIHCHFLNIVSQGVWYDYDLDSHFIPLPPFSSPLFCRCNNKRSMWHINICVADRKTTVKYAFSHSSWTKDIFCHMYHTQFIHCTVHIIISEWNYAAL